MMDAFECRIPDQDPDGVDARRVDAYDEEAAAIIYARVSDAESADYSIASGNAAAIRVRNLQDRSVRNFFVQGEVVPEYHAYEL